MPRSSHEEFYAQSSLPMVWLNPARKLLAGCIVFCDSDSCAKHKGLWERLNPARSSLRMVWLNPARSSESKFQETIVPRVARVLHVLLRHLPSAKPKGFWEGQHPRCPIRRRTGNEDVAPPVRLNPARSSSEMGFCASCREAPAVVLRFSCQRSNWLIPLPLSKCASTPSKRA